MSVLVFFDTEFTDLSPDARLISIGLISEDGRRIFYAELSDTYSLKDCSDFTRNVVLPLLEGGDARISKQELIKRLADWLRSFGEPVTLSTDSFAWDWPWIKEIFKEPGAWPENLERFPVLLTTDYLVEYDSFVEALERAFAEGLRQHHSLDDAKANRLGWIAAGGERNQDIRKCGSGQ